MKHARPVDESSLANPVLTDAGDKRLPKCRRCQQSDSVCLYPTHRKRPTLEAKYESFRRKLIDSNQEDALGEIPPTMIIASRS